MNDYEKKDYTVMVKTFININKMNTPLSPQIIEDIETMKHTDGNPGPG